MSLEELRAHVFGGGAVRTGSSAVRMGAGGLSGAGAAKGKRSHKYNAKKVAYDGYEFDSDGEYKRYRVLKLAEIAGLISDIVLQPKYILGIRGPDGSILPAKIKSGGYPNGRKVTWRGDFRYKTKDGQTVIEDYKGKDLYESRLKRAWIECLYDVQIRIVTDANEAVGPAESADQAQDSEKVKSEHGPGVAKLRSDAPQKGRRRSKKAKP